MNTKGPYNAAQLVAALENAGLKAAKALEPYLNISSSSTASSITITDAGGYYTGTDVEAALQEVGTALAGVGGSILLDNCAFVATNGDDGTGTLGDLSKPFLTIQAAIAVCSYDQTVVVFPGIYDTTTAVILKDGVNLHFLGSGYLTRTTSGPLFTNDSVYVFATIYAPAWSFGALGAYSTGSYVLECTSFSFITFVASYVSAFDACIKVVGADSTDGYYLFKIDEIRTQGSDEGAITASGIQYLNVIADKISNGNVGGTADYSDGIINTNLVTETYIKARAVISTAEDGAGIKVRDANVGDKMFLNIGYLETVEGWPLYPESTVTVYAHIDHIKSPSDCLAVSSADSVVYLYDCLLEATRDNASEPLYEPDGIIHGEGAVIYAIGCTIKRSAATTGGFDLRTTGDIGRVYVQNTSFNMGRIRRVSSSDEGANMWQWLGNAWCQLPVLENTVDGNALVVENCILIGGRINLNSHINCTLLNVTSTDSTITFTVDGETIQNHLYHSGTTVV